TNVYLEQSLSIYNYGIADLGSGFYAKIVNVNANKDVAVDCTNTNGNVIIYDKSEAGDHIWKFNRNDDGSYKITNTLNGKCLDLAYGANSDGANVGIWDDNGGSNQKWYIYNVNGRYALKAACSDRVVDVYGGSIDNMSNVQTWTFNGGNNQLFGIEIIDYKGTLADLGTSFNAKIGNVNADKDVSADLSNANGNVIIYDKSNAADHIWRFDRYADGSYKITNTYNGKCLDVYAASAESGANVALWEDNGGANQKWYIYSYDGNYVLKSACTDCYLDVYGSGTDNFTNVHMWEFNGGRNQQFTIDKV
ncbi:MAG: RICIN domain-containing protein, partial [Ruminococcus sp.]